MRKYTLTAKVTDEALAHIRSLQRQSELQTPEMRSDLRLEPRGNETTQVTVYFYASSDEAACVRARAFVRFKAVGFKPLLVKSPFWRPVKLWPQYLERWADDLT